MGTMDVTIRLARYREAARHVWNTELHQEANLDVLAQFEYVCSALVSAFVLGPLGISREQLSACHPRDLFSGLRLMVIPISDRASVPVHVNRSSPRTGYWDDPISAFSPEDAKLRLVDFFDWDDLSRRDFEFVEVAICESQRYPGLVGRAALVPFSYVRIVVPVDDVSGAVQIDGQ